MTSYTIAITSSDITQASAVLTMHVDSSERRVTEISVRLGTGKRPLPDELTKFDFRSILETVVLLSRGQLPDLFLATAGDAGLMVSGVKLHKSENGTRGSVSTPPQPRTLRRRQLPGRTATASKKPYGNAPSTKTQNQREDIPSDLAVVYWREGTIAKVADHYSVPRHIAQRWIKLLRKGGTVPNPWRPARQESGD